MLSKCVNCEFNVMDGEKFCQNCGLFSPKDSFQADSDRNQSNLTIVVTGVLTLIFFLLIAYLRSDGRFDNWREFPYIFIGSLIVGFAFAVIFSMLFIHRLAKKERKTRLVNQRANETFRSIGETIAMRRTELEERCREIEELLSHRGKNERNAEILQRARELLAKQIARYELRQHQLSLIYLQNDLRPVFYETNLRRRARDFMTLTDHSIEEISEIRAELINYHAIEFPPSTGAERDNFLAYLKETESVFLKIREALANRRADHSAETSVPFDEDVLQTGEQIFARTAENFNIQMSLTDFSESFDEMEREYKRLRAETEVSQKFLTE